MLDYKLLDLSKETVDSIKKLAVSYEDRDLQVAKELMYLAYLARPTGGFIKKKLEEYNKKREQSPAEIKLKKMIREGELAIVPAGFRCSTKKHINEKLGISQESLVFDVGFFPPRSVASVIRDPNIDLKFDDDGSTHAICTKDEMYLDKKLGHIFRFLTSSYDEIDSFVTNKNISNLDHYLDSTFGYYTLVKRHKFVLAHYNWHKFADIEKSKGITDKASNINNINSILNRRIKRMFDKCSNAKYSVFIYQAPKRQKYMMIDDEYFDLTDISEIKSAVNDVFSTKSYVAHMNEVDDPANLLRLIGENAPNS